MEVTFGGVEWKRIKAAASVPMLKGSTAARRTATDLKAKVQKRLKISKIVRKQELQAAKLKSPCPKVK